MKVRSATQKDWPDIKRLMIDFANFNPVEDLKNPNFNPKHVDNVLHYICEKGVAIVCEHNNRVIGILLATIQGDLWLPHVKRMTEVAWWVEKEYRGSTAGARLLKYYIALGIEMKEQDYISSFTLTTLATTPDMKLEKRGWNPVEFNWVFEG